MFTIYYKTLKNEWFTDTTTWLNLSNSAEYKARLK